MGFFSFFKDRQFKPDPRVIRDLVEVYISLGMPRGEAKRVVTLSWLVAKRSSLLAGTFRSPLDLGDRIIAVERGDPKDNERYVKSNELRSLIRSTDNEWYLRNNEWYSWIRLEGVTDDDIRWWWNRRDVERHWFEHDDETTARAAFRDLVGTRNMEPVDAMAEIHRSTPRYDLWPTLNEKDKYPTPALPWELRHRINRFMRASEQTGELDELRKQYQTMNEIVRAKIKEGKL